MFEMINKKDIYKIVYENVSNAVIKDKSFIIAANWKMNKNTKEITEFLKNLNGMNWSNKNTVIIFPPFPYLYLARDILRYSKAMYGMQDMHWEKNGAFTGEVSPEMAKDFGCKYVIIGHSERRSIFSEEDSILKQKLNTAISNGLLPIFCVGENLDERKGGRLKAVIRSQIINGIGLLEQEYLRKLIIAYEPVWAIGTGLNAEPDQIEETHDFIKVVLKELFGAEAENIPILYGGSVNTENVKNIALVESVSGFLIGRASLKQDEFSQIIRFLE